MQPILPTDIGAQRYKRELIYFISNVSSECVFVLVAMVKINGNATFFPLPYLPIDNDRTFAVLVIFNNMKRQGIYECKYFFAFETNRCRISTFNVNPPIPLCMKSSSVDVGCIRIMKQFSTISLFKFDESNTDSLCRKQMSFHGPHYLTFDLIRGTSTSETANNDVKFMLIFSQHGTNPQ